MASRWAALLFVAAWSMGCGEAFRCYSCEQPVAMSSCKNITYCKPEDTACITTLVTVEAEYPFNQIAVVTRSCSSSCQATDPDSIGTAHLIYCCFRDLCNSVAQRSAPSSYSPTSSGAAPNQRELPHGPPLRHPPGTLQRANTLPAVPPLEPFPCIVARLPDSPTLHQRSNGDNAPGVFGGQRRWGRGEPWRAVPSLGRRVGGGGTCGSSARPEEGARASPRSQRRQDPSPARARRAGGDPGDTAPPRSATSTASSVKSDPKGTAGSKAPEGQQGAREALCPLLSLEDAHLSHLSPRPSRQRDPRKLGQVTGGSSGSPPTGAAPKGLGTKLSPPGGLPGP
ncbi:PREDICTED: ras and Rab interactor 3-like [Galeopterus variegatus]|uniref:Ras and Rab interactor 3-like n=1 Tax=Galeopterus variegatus TaxID=482537 RepID=A0ABM0RLB8_GALVR|nr:PREDICTED: ras and Rab interactor 3-like [Galeopterus variegatus]